MTATNVTVDQIKAGMLQPGIFLSSAQFTFSIANGSSAWTADYGAGSEPFSTGYAVLTADQAAAFRLAMSAWDYLIAPDFLEVADTASQYGEVRVAFTGMDAGTAGYAYQSEQKTPFSKAGDVWLNPLIAPEGFAQGGDNFETLIHEIGHVLGLKHPFEGAPLPAGFDSVRYTVMSYTPVSSGVVLGFGPTANGITTVLTRVNAATPMVFDIAAIQALYGAEETTAAGNDTYRFQESTTYVQSLYDAGGNDTIDLSNFTRPVLLDLTPGAYSSLGYWPEAAQVAYWTNLYPNFATFIQDQFNKRDTHSWTDNLGIAFSTTIENGIGGAGDDVLIGNAAANYLSGGAGTDSISGGGGRNTADGGAGNDTLVLSGARSDYKIFSVNGFDFLIGGSDAHKVTGFEQANFASGNVGWTELKASAVAFDPSAYLAANADLAAVFGTNLVAAADHYVQFGFAEGRPTGAAAAPFDALSYLAANADLARIFGLDFQAATEHYQSYGIKEGRPTSGFDALLYVASNADLARIIGNDPAAGTRHFVEFGADEGRPTTSFNALQYLASNADLARLFGNDPARAVNHYLDFGADEGRPTNSFDAIQYIASNSDLARLFGNDPARGTTHFVEFGADEGRPTSGFDTLLYLASSPDLAQVFGLDTAGGIRHFLDFGADEGRSTRGFDAMRYIASHADLIRALGSNPAGGLDHYLRFGADEGRSTNSFDPMRYLDAHADLVAAFGRDAAAASDHYVRYGFYEGRSTGGTSSAAEPESAVAVSSIDDASLEWLDEAETAAGPDFAAARAFETLLPQSFDGVDPAAGLHLIHGMFEDLSAGSSGFVI